MRLSFEAASIPGVAEHDEAMRLAQAFAARAIVRRGIDRGELDPGTSVALLLDTLVGGAMMHALSTPEQQRRAELASAPGSHARRLVDFLLNAATARPPHDAG